MGSAPSQLSVPTYSGPVAAEALGVTLMHEHVFVLSHELAATYPDAVGFDESAAVERAVGRLASAYEAGVRSIVDLTVLGLGRHPALVAEVAARTPIHILAATGVYALRDLPLPLRLRAELTRADPDPLVDLFVRDIVDGIAGHGVRAAILKVATDKAGLTPDVERCIRAVARASMATGAPISTHTHARSRRGLDQIRVLAEEGVPLDRVVIGHCGDTDDLDYLHALLEAGATLGMDRFGLDMWLSNERRVKTVAVLCDEGWAARLVLSHDACSFHDAVPGGDLTAHAPTNVYSHLLTNVVPALRAAGVTDDQLHLMLVANPRRILCTEPGGVV